MNDVIFRVSISHWGLFEVDEDSFWSYLATYYETDAVDG